MNLSRLLPILVMAGIGMHGTKALERRLTSLDREQKAVFARHNMRHILRAAAMEAALDESFTIRDFPYFVRTNMKNRLGVDPMMDPWGNAYRHKLERGRLSIFSAGADRKWSTSDDVVESTSLNQY